MKIEIKPTGSLYDIVVPLRLSRENEWLKKVALVGSVIDEWQKLGIKLWLASNTTGLNLKRKKEDTLNAIRQFKEKVRNLPDELNLGGRKLKKIFYDFIVALEEMHQSDDPVLQQTLEQVKFKIDFKEIRESWGNVSYVLFLHYESNKLHPLQFFYYIAASYPEGIFFPSLVLMRIYDFSRYDREFKFNIKHDFNKTVEISGPKNEREVEKMIYEMLPKPAYTTSFKPEIEIKKGRNRPWEKTKWIVNIKSVSYEVRMPYISGTISEEVLPELDDLLILLQPYKIVKIGNITGAQFVENILTLEPKPKQKKKSPKQKKPSPQKPENKSSQPPQEAKNKSSQPLKSQETIQSSNPKQEEQANKPKYTENKPEQDNTQSVKTYGKASTNIPIQWILLGLGIVAILVWWMKNRR
jgi:hypothetical protein